MGVCFIMIFSCFLKAIINYLNYWAHIFYMESLAKSGRIFYLDALRALAIICVISIHIYALTGNYAAGCYPDIDFDWIFTQILGNPSRIGVGLFFMLSGALSLGREWEIKQFLSKRIPRIVVPFVFWNAVLLSIYISFSYYGIFYFVKSFDLGSLWHYAYNSFLGHGTGFGPNWFFWEILGIYLVMPVINRWLANCELYEAEYFLALWIVTSIFDFTLNMVLPIPLTYFASPLGFVVLGYYLRYTEREIFKNRRVIWGLIIVPTALILIKSYYLSSPTFMYYAHRYAIEVIAIASGVFLLFKNTDFHADFEAIQYKIVFALAKYSYGIYLFHYTVILLLMRFVILDVGHVEYMAIMFGLTVICSLVIMYGLEHIPYINRLVGAK